MTNSCTILKGELRTDGGEDSCTDVCEELKSVELRRELDTEDVGYPTVDDMELESPTDLSLYAQGKLVLDCWMDL